MFPGPMRFGTLRREYQWNQLTKLLQPNRPHIRNRASVARPRTPPAASFASGRERIVPRHSPCGRNTGHRHSKNEASPCSIHTIHEMQSSRPPQRACSHHTVKRGAAPFPREPAALVLRESRSEEHTSELQSLTNLVCRLLLEKKKKQNQNIY